MWMKVLDAHFAKKKPATLCELLGDLTIAARLQIDFSHRLGGSNPEQPDGNNGTEYSKTRYGPSRRISRRQQRIQAGGHTTSPSPGQGRTTIGGLT